MKTILIICGLILLTSCTIYTEKQTEALSRVVYATKDSLDQGRIDLADEYSKESTRIVKPPKNRIKIDPIFENLYLKGSIKENTTDKSSLIISSKNASSSNITSSEKSSINLNTSELPPLIEKQRVLIVPEKFKGASVIVVHSLEYEKLLKDQQIFKQLQKDHENLSQAKKNVDEELIKQQKFHDQMVIDLNNMQKQLVEKDLAILKRNVTIGIMGIIMVLGVYLRMKGVL